MYSNKQLFVGCGDRTIKELSLPGEIIRAIHVTFRPYDICRRDDGSMYSTDCVMIFYTV